MQFAHEEGKDLTQDQTSVNYAFKSFPTANNLIFIQIP